MVEQEEENIPFEERWRRLLDDCDEKLKDLRKENRDYGVRDMWTQINRFVTIMAVPKSVMWRMRRTLCRMAWRSSWSQGWTVLQYMLMTFLPRPYYRNVTTQQWFKQRLKNKN